MDVSPTPMPSSGGTSIYPSSFDSYTNIFICGNSDGSSILECDVQSLAFWYTGAIPTSQDTFLYPYGVYPTLLGDYQMTSPGMGFIKNSLGPQGSLTIVNPATAIWDSTEDLGYKFLGNDVFSVTFGSLNSGGTISASQKSLTISFWMKTESIPTQTITLFQYWSENMGVTVFSLQLTTSNSISLTIRPDTVTLPQPIALGTWKLITASFLVGEKNIFSCYFEDSREYLGSFLPSFPIAVFSSNDLLLFGGMGTKMYNLKIFSPGSRLVAKPPSTSSSCALYLGSPSTCIWELPCSSTGCGTCSSVFCSSCIEGFKMAFSECNPCPSRTYYSSSSLKCLNCSANCQTCDDAMTCTGCDANYELLDGFCANPSACPSDPEDYLYTDDKVCRETCSYPYIPTVVSPVNKFCSLDIDSSDYEKVKSLVNGAQAGGTASTVIGLLVSLVDSANPSAFTMASITKMLQYMKFLQIGYPPKLYLMLLLQKTASGGLNFVPEMSDTMKAKIPNNPLPIQFEIHKVHSNFLVGFWPPFMSMVIILGVIGILYLMEIYMEDSKKVHDLVKKISPHLRWNLFLTVFCSNFCDLAFYTAANFMSINFESGIAVFGFILCLSLNTLAFFILGFMGQKIIALQTARSHKSSQGSLEDARQQNQKYSMVFEPYQEKTFLQQGFVIFFSIRAYIYSAVVGYLYNYPVVQAVLLFLLPIVGLLYLFIKKPMKILINYIQQIFCEIVLLSVNFCVLIMSVIDQNDPLNTRKKEGLGVFIMAVNLIISWSLPVFSGFKVVLIIREQMKARKLAEPKLPPRDTDMNLQTTTVDPVSFKKVPRIQTTRPAPTFDHELSNYQINDHDNSIIELTGKRPRNNFQ